MDSRVRGLPTLTSLICQYLQTRLSVWLLFSCRSVKFVGVHLYVADEKRQSELKLGPVWSPPRWKPYWFTSSFQLVACHEQESKPEKREEIRAHFEVALFLELQKARLNAQRE